MEIKEYKTWLYQFDDQDRKYAEKLVSSLIYIGKEEFDSSFQQLFKSHISSSEVSAFFIVRESPYDKIKKVYTKEFWETPDSTPLIYENPDDIGSEGDLAHLLRDLTRENDNFLIHPSITKMREKRCRHLIFINDVAGTGTQTQTFVDWILQNKTIRSWISFHNIRDIVLLHYAVTNKAESLFKKNKLIKSYSARLITSGCCNWTYEEKKRIPSICVKYGKKANISKDWYLGYEESCLLYLFPTGAPNNLPGILWKKTDSWIPLFNRNRPDFTPKITQYFSFFERIKKTYKQLFFQKKTILQIVENNELLILVLQNIYKRKNNVRKMSLILNTSVFIINDAIEKIQKYEWVDKNMKITNKGRKVIKYIEKKQKEKNHLENNNDFYYPKSIRAPVD